MAIDGQTVVAGSKPTYAFTELPGGWSGVVHQTAQLTAAGGAAADDFGNSVAISGGTIVVSDPSVPAGPNRTGVIYVFVEPQGGWASETETAKLVAQNAGLAPHMSTIAISGDTVVAPAPAQSPNGLDVFTEPAGGWAGTVHETATLTSSGGSLLSAATVTDQLVVSGKDVFVKPPGGWVNETQSATLDCSGPSDLGAASPASDTTIVVGSCV